MVTEKICQGYCEGPRVVAEKICQGYHEGLDELFMKMDLSVVMERFC